MGPGTADCGVIGGAGAAGADMGTNRAGHRTPYGGVIRARKTGPVTVPSRLVSDVDGYGGRHG